jgi:hypothetical protein
MVNSVKDTWTVSFCASLKRNRRGAPSGSSTR